MSNSLIQTTRFRIAFGIWWAAWSLLHFIVLNQAGFAMRLSLYDSIISTSLLAGAVLLVVCSLQFYLPGSRRYTYLFGLCACLCVICTVAGRAILISVLQEENGYRSFLSQTVFIRGAIAFIVISCGMLISVLWYTLQDQQEAEKRRNDADRLAREAELNSLRQQLQPHFLFNSLNSINALVGMQPQKARTMIQQLSDFLRGTLNKEQKEWITLEEELQHLGLYLEIEKVRFGHRLSTEIKNETIASRLPVMLLQPVVENAIKFGLYDTVDDVTISIKAREEPGYLIVEVSNPFDTETSSPQKGTGFGLSSIQRRLYLLFARQDLLQTIISENIFITIIKIPQP